MAKRRRRSKKWVFWVFFLLLVVAAGVMCWLVWDNYFAKKEDDGSSQIDDVTKSDPTGKGEVGQEDAMENNDKKVVLYDGDDPNDLGGLTGVITRAGVLGDNLVLRVNIDQYLSEGSCKLELIKNNIVEYSGEAQIVDLASTSTCEGFDIPASEIGSGNFQIVINLRAGDKTGVISGEVNI